MSSTRSLFSCAYALELRTSLPEPFKDLLIPIYPWFDFSILLPHKLFISSPILFPCSLRFFVLLGAYDNQGCYTFLAAGHGICNTFQKRLLPFLLLSFSSHLWLMWEEQSSSNLLPLSGLQQCLPNFCSPDPTSQNVVKLFLLPGQHSCTHHRADFSGFQGFLTQPISLDSKQVCRKFSKQQIPCIQHKQRLGGVGC